MNRQDAVTLCHAIPFDATRFFDLFRIIVITACLCQGFSNFKGCMGHHLIQKVIHLVGITAATTFGKYILGDDSILLNQIDGNAPITSIINGTVEKHGYYSIVEGQVGRLEKEFQEKICLLK